MSILIYKASDGNILSLSEKWTCPVTTGEACISNAAKKVDLPQVAEVPFCIWSFFCAGFNDIGVT